MMVLRKLAVALLSAGVMLPGLSHALAVKELQTKSALGEPFRAEVELIELGDLNANEIRVTLASAEDFERMGIDRVYFLNDLRFDVEVNPGGRSFVRITSTKPVVEPYLDFVVRIAWPGNARLQEVTALLDPPLIADSAAAAIEAPAATVAQPPVAEPAPAPVEVAPAPVAEETAPPAPVVAQPAPTPAPAPAPAPAVVAPRPVPVVAPDGYRVQAGDTAGRIAERFRGGASASQAMIALQRANPAAFANNNINQLKRGQVLRIPSEEQMREVSAQEAQASLREQTTRWRASIAKAAPKPALEAAQVDATAKAEAPKPAPVPASKPEMKLLGAEAGKAGTSTSGKDKPSAAKPADDKKLAQVKSQADAARAEKEKLAGKVQSLDARVKANDQKVNVQNARLAQLEGQLKDAQAKAEAAKADAAKAATAKIAADKAAAAKAEADKAAAAKAEADKVAAAKAEADKAAQAGAAKPADAAPATAAEAEANAAAPAAAPVPAPAPAPKAVVVEEPPVEESGPLGLILGGVAALLAVGGAGWWWNRRRKEQEEAEATLAELEGLDEEAVPGDAGDFTAVNQDSTDDLDDSWLNSSAPAAPAVAAAASDRVLADPLEEAEQYIAYERYPQAVGLLTKALAASPDRADLRMKLLEVYAHLDDWNGFSEQSSWFEQAGDLESLSRAEELKAGMTPPAATAAASDDGLLDFVSSAPRSAAASDGLPSLEDLEMDFNSTATNLSSPVLEAVKDEDFGLDLDGFDSTPAVAAAAPAAADDAGLDDLSFELDHDAFDAPAATADELSFDLDEPAPASAAATGSGLGDLTDLDAELAFEPSSPEPAAAAPSKEDDDLSFSLDDLEVAAEPVSAPEMSLDEDFSLDTGDLPADDLSLELGTDAGAADELAAGEFSLDEAADTSSLDDLAADFDAGLTSEPATAPVVEAAPATAAADLGMDDEFDFLADTDENATKLDLARAYIDMGDMEGARDILQEVLTEGSSPQKDEARGLLAQVG